MNPLAGVMPTRVYHKPRNKQYAYGCTEAAIIRAAKDHDSLDLDLTIDADDVGWCNHWSQLMLRDAWRDPEGLLNHRAGISTLPTADVTRLASPWGPILTAAVAMHVCAREGVIPCFEIKRDPKGRDHDPTWWAAFRVLCDALESDPVIMSLPRAGKGIQALKAAHGAGFRTMWLWRGAYPARYDAYLTFVKSRPKHPIYRVSPDPVHIPIMPVLECCADLVAYLRLT